MPFPGNNTAIDCNSLAYRQTFFHAPYTTLIESTDALTICHVTFTV